LVAKGVMGLFPAASVGDDIEIYSDTNKESAISVLHTIRQQGKKTGNIPNIALADFVRPKEMNGVDFVGMFAVTAGLEIEKQIAEYEKEHDDYKIIRTDYWGYAKEENLTNEELIKEKYIGIRPAPGYPAQPDHTEKVSIFKLLDVQNVTGISLTESLAMYPAASVCGIYFANPEAKYFSVGKIGEDQVADYSLRKGINLKEAEKWLRPILNYND
jgi:5-methyltetrahydrofolate--homocysteine methyltransferase